MVRAAFPPHGPKRVAGTMNRIVPEFHVNVRRALEDPLIHLVRLIRPAPNPAERVINRDFIGLAEILVDHFQVARIERAVELRPSAEDSVASGGAVRCEISVVRLTSLADRLWARGRTVLTDVPEQQQDLRLAAKALTALLRSFNKHDVLTAGERRLKSTSRFRLTCPASCRAFLCRVACKG